MPKPKKPRKPYQRPNWKAEAARLDPEKYGPVPEKGSEEAEHFNHVWGNAKLPEDTVRFTDPPAHAEPPAAPSPAAARPRKPRPPKSVPVDKEPPAPAHPHVVHPTSPRALSSRGRYLVPVAAGAGVIGGAAFLAHRARQRKATMVKALVNPLTGTGVTFEKRYLEDDIDETPGGVLVAKRHDETALQRHGSRRVGGNTPVSSTKVSGLPVQSARFSRGNAEARPGTRSHALGLLHVHTKVKHHSRGTLVRIGHSRSATPRPVKTVTSKAFGYSQSAGSGRRLVNV